MTSLLDLSDEEFAEKFLEMLATPKNSIVIELLSNDGKFSDISD